MDYRGIRQNDMCSICHTEKQIINYDKSILLSNIDFSNNFEYIMGWYCNKCFHYMYESIMRREEVRLLKWKQKMIENEKKVIQPTN